MLGSNNWITHLVILSIYHLTTWQIIPFLALKSSCIQLYLNLKLIRPASIISLSRSYTQLRPFLKKERQPLFADTAEYTRTFAQKFPALTWCLGLTYRKWYFILKELLSIDARNVLWKNLSNRFKRSLILLYLQNIMKSKSPSKTRSLPSGSPASLLTQSQRSDQNRILVSCHNLTFQII